MVEKQKQNIPKIPIYTLKLLWMQLCNIKWFLFWKWNICVRTIVAETKFRFHSMRHMDRKRLLIFCYVSWYLHLACVYMINFKRSELSLVHQWCGVNIYVCPNTIKRFTPSSLSIKWKINANSLCYYCNTRDLFEYLMDFCLNLFLISR